MSKDDVSIFQRLLLSSNFKIYMHSCYALLLLQKVYGQLIGSNLHPTYHQSADSASADVGLHVCFCNYKYSYNHHIAFCLLINLVALKLGNIPNPGYKIIFISSTNVYDMYVKYNRKEV